MFEFLLWVIAVVLTVVGFGRMFVVKDWLLGAVLAVFGVLMLLGLATSVY